MLRKELDASGEQHKDRRGSPGPVLGVVGGAGVVDVGVGSPRPPEVRAGLGFGRGGEIGGGVAVAAAIRR